MSKLGYVDIDNQHQMRSHNTGLMYDTYWNDCGISHELSDHELGEDKPFAPFDKPKSSRYPNSLSSKQVSLQLELPAYSNWGFFGLIQKFTTISMSSEPFYRLGQKDGGDLGYRLTNIIEFADETIQKTEISPRELEGLEEPEGPGESTETAELTNFSEGDMIEAKWMDMSWRSARIQQVSEPFSVPSYLVCFVGFNNSITVDQNSIRCPISKAKPWHGVAATASVGKSSFGHIFDNTKARLETNHDDTESDTTNTHAIKPECLGLVEMEKLDFLELKRKEQVICTKHQLPQDAQSGPEAHIQPQRESCKSNNSISALISLRIATKEPLESTYRQQDDGKTLQLEEEFPYLCGSENDDFDAIDVSSDECDVDCVRDIEAQKEHVLDRLMVCVYEMFTSAGSFMQYGHTSTNSQSPPKQSSESSGVYYKDTGGKRGTNKGSKGRDDEDNEDDENGQSGKRRRTRNELGRSRQKMEKSLACPYYKRNPRKHHSSRACCGPGWDTVHRIKGHLYRVHALPLHCRRCYATFGNESQLTDHSRSTDGCIVRDAEPMEGFNKDQEKALKGRQAMFHAESEEEKWKIVYLILFPDTALGELPSPYYDPNDYTLPEQPESGSPKPAELEQFDAFLRRELPKTIRKSLQAALESSFGPIEETLKNELENIVRDAQETLTRSYIGGVQMSDLASGVLFASTGNAQPTQSSSVANLDMCNPAQPIHFGTDALSQYFVPPDAILASLPDLAPPSDKANTCATLSDSAYYSFPENAFLDDAWFDSIPAPYIFGDTVRAEDAEDQASGPAEAIHSLGHYPFQESNEKGTQRARFDKADVEVNISHFDELS